MKNLAFVSATTLSTGLLIAAGLPWWSTTLFGALAGWLWAQSNRQGFWGGFVGGLLLWLIFALVRDVDNEGLLSTRIGALFMGLSRWGVLGITGLLGGFLGAMGALTGYRARVWWRVK